VLKKVPERTTLIGRVRKDSVFFHPPQVQPSHGRKRKYGPRCPTPEELLKDDQRPWQRVQAYAAGKRHQFEVKTLSPVYTQMDKAQTPLRLVVIKPVRYRLSKNPNGSTRAGLPHLHRPESAPGKGAAILFMAVGHRSEFSG